MFQALGKSPKEVSKGHEHGGEGRSQVLKGFAELCVSLTIGKPLSQFNRNVKSVWLSCRTRVEDGGSHLQQGNHKEARDSISCIAQLVRASS